MEGLDVKEGRGLDFLEGFHIKGRSWQKVKDNVDQNSSMVA